VDDKTNLRRAEKLLRRKNFTEAKDIYSELLSTNSVDDKYWSHNFDNYRIVMCSMNKAKCHLRLGEYNEAISTIDRCISHEDVMKEGSKFNKVHLYQRLAAAYLMRMEYRACLLVCIYGLTQFNNDEKLLSIQKHINTRY
jgi:tetratricopeptide (TPR) repeat protein